jgi:hypothetical protein
MTCPECPIATTMFDNGWRLHGACHSENGESDRHDATTQLEARSSELPR